MKSRNVHDFPTTLYQQKYVCFFLFRFIFSIVVVKEGKEKNEGEFILFLKISELFSKYNLPA